MTFSEDSDDYGFFCDLESVKTMEYEEVVFYVVTTKTHYEVRRKHATRPVVQGPPPTTVRKIAETKSSTENVKDLLRPKDAVIPQRRESHEWTQGDTNTLKTPYKSENKIKAIPYLTPFSRQSRNTQIPYLTPFSRQSRNTQIPYLTPFSRQSRNTQIPYLTPFSRQSRNTPKPQNRVISFLKRLPRDIYYSLVVCCTTASCVYLFMSHPKMYDE
jgi:hypothetical protein